MKVHLAQPRWIVKRDGTRQRFKPEKIRRAVLMAFDAANKNGIPNVDPLVDAVIRSCNPVATDDPEAETIHIEKVQDHVEQALMRLGYDEVAKQYILYREERARLRAERLTPDPTIASDYMHAARYARVQPELGRREVFLETSHRDRDMHLRRYPEDVHPLIKWAWEFVDRREVMPSMRSMQFGGRAIELNNTRMYNCGATAVDRVRAFDQIFYVLLCGCGVGASVQWHHIDQLPPVQRISRRVRHFSIPDSIEGWGEAARMLMESFFKFGEHVEYDYSDVRDENTWLETSGGLAPGHLPLKEALEAVREILLRAANRKIRPIEAFDVICLFAEAVRAGGIRRSSLWIGFSPEDTEMLYAKAKGIYDPMHGVNLHRRMANTSAYLVRSRAQREMFDRIIRIAEDGFGDPGFYLTNSRDYIPNPCVTGDTRILTNRGWKRIVDVESEEVEQDARLGGKLQSHGGLVNRGVKSIYRLDTVAGYSMRLTADHRVMTQRGWVPAADLMSSDRIHIFSSQLTEIDAPDDMAAYEAAGWYVGDGAWTASAPRLDFYAEKQMVGRRLAPRLYELNMLPEGWKFIEGDNVLRLGRKSMLECPVMREVYAEKLRVPESVWRGTEGQQAAFLRGLFSADGTVRTDPRGGAHVRLWSVSLDLIRDVQLLLLGLGIVSTQYKFRVDAGIRKLPDGKGGLQSYSCQAGHDLQICKTNLLEFDRLIGFLPGSPHIEKLENALSSFSRGPYSEKFTTRIRSLEYCGEERVYDLKNVKETHAFVAEGIVVHNCVEIGMFPFLVKKLARRSGVSFCNLTDTSCSGLETIQEFSDRVRAASIIGTLQAGYTTFDYLGPVTEEIVRRDALLGVGLTGVADSPLANDPQVLKAMAAVACETNREVAHKIGIRPAARVTTGKPAGKTSVAMGCISNGWHARYASRYLFRITAKPDEPPAIAFAKVNPHAVEKKPDGEWALVFPMQAPANAITIKDESAIDFLERVRTGYESWIVPGTQREDDSPGLTHSISATCTVRPGELEDVVDYIWNHRDSFAAMSFAPYTLDKRYPFAPWEVADDDHRWNELIRNMRPVDWKSVPEAIPGGENYGSACEGPQCGL